MRYYLIAGEASGDLHGSNLITELLKLDPLAEIRFWGGDRMENASGKKPIKHIKELAFMGFAEVIMNIRTIKNNIDFCKNDIIAYYPDVVVFIDYPGFNLRIASFAKQNGFKTAYYISPTIWAWKESRVEKVKKYIDRMMVILPFEKDFYKKHGVDVDFVGNPLLDAVDDIQKSNTSSTNKKPVIALLPGSRTQEIIRILPIMVSIRKSFPDYDFEIAAVKSHDELFYKRFVGDEDIKIKYSSTSEILSKAEAGLVTSGTATLEAAIYNMPQVVCYKASPISYLIAKQLVKVKYISLVNLILNKAVVKELIQSEMNTGTLLKELRNILPGGSKRLNIFEDYSRLKMALGGKGASARVAEIIYLLAKR